MFRPLLLLLCTVPMYANLIGDSVQVDWLYPNSSTVFASTNVVVGPGVEITCPGADPLCTNMVPATFDFGAMSILNTYPGATHFDNTAFNGFDFSSLDVGGAGITGVSLSTNISGLDASRVAWGSDYVRVNLEDLWISPGQYYRFDLQSGTPEPATVLLLATGLPLLAVLRRRLRS